MREELRHHQWAYIGVAMAFVSTAIGNMFHLAPKGQGMYAVHIYLVSIVILMFLYSLLLTFKVPRSALAKLLLGICVGWLAVNIYYAEAVTQYALPQQLYVLAVKCFTVLLVVCIFVSISTNELYERLVWAVLIAYEGFSVPQYVLCSMGPKNGWGPDQYLHWGEQTAEAACVRAFGPVWAYADIIVCGVVLASVVLYRIRGRI